MSGSMTVAERTNCTCRPWLCRPACRHPSARCVYLDGQRCISKHAKSSGCSDGVRAVCKCFNAHAHIHAQARKHLDITGSKRATLLPYSPMLQSLIADHALTGFVHRILRGPTPQLTSLTVAFDFLQDIPAIVSTLACNSQLTELSFCVSFSFDPELHIEPPAPHGQPRQELPSLPALRRLSLLQPACYREASAPDAGYEEDEVAVPPIRLSSLSEMSLLTSLTLCATALDNEAVPNESDTTATMVPVCEALGRLSELRKLEVDCWTLSPDAAEFPCWEAFALGALSLKHLTRFEVRRLLLPENHYRIT